MEIDSSAAAAARAINSFPSVFHNFGAETAESPGFGNQLSGDRRIWEGAKGLLGKLEIKKCIAGKRRKSFDRRRRAEN